MIWMFRVVYNSLKAIKMKGDLDGYEWCIGDLKVSFRRIVGFGWVEVDLIPLKSLNMIHRWYKVLYRFKAIQM